MPNLGAILLVTSASLLAVSTNSISKDCRLHDETKITCVCVDDMEFLLPEGYNYENVTSLSVSSCSSANLHFSSLTEATRIEEVHAQNISGRLRFELFLTSRAIRAMRLSNIGTVPVITHDTFTSLSRIELLEIRDATIGHFAEQFNDIQVVSLIMENVTVARLDGINLSERGSELRIINTELRNVTTSLNFGHFASVEIASSKFVLQRPGHVSIESERAIVSDSVFTNVSMNIVATGGIAMNSTCADGKSSLRLSASRIESFGNRLPTEIVYTRSAPTNEPEGFATGNNTVCIAGNCRCSKSNGQVSFRPIFSILIVEIAILSL